MTSDIDNISKPDYHTDTHTHTRARAHTHTHTHIHTHTYIYMYIYIYIYERIYIYIYLYSDAKTDCLFSLNCSLWQVQRDSFKLGSKSKWFYVSRTSFSRAIVIFGVNEVIPEKSYIWELYLRIYIYIYIRRSLNKFPDIFLYGHFHW